MLQLRSFQYYDGVKVMIHLQLKLLQIFNSDLFPGHQYMTQSPLMKMSCRYAPVSCKIPRVNNTYLKPFCTQRVILVFLFLNSVQWTFHVAQMVKNPSANAGDTDLIPGLGRSPGGRHGNPLQYSFLENPMDRGAWQATVPRVAKGSDTT